MKKNHTLLKVAKFCVGGGAGVAVYYASLYTLTEFVHVWYVVSAVIAFVLNYAVNFTLQKFWTFENKDTKTIRRQIVMYFSMGVVFLPTNTLLLYLLVDYVHIQYLLAQLILTGVLSVASYFITHKIFTT